MQKCRFWFFALISFLGFSPEGGRSPVEYRGNLYVRTKSQENTAQRPESAPYRGLGQSQKILIQALRDLSLALDNLSQPLGGPT